MSNEFKSNQKSDLIYWLIAVGLLFTGIAAPVGVVMIVLKLMGGKKKGRHPYYMQRDGEAPAGARTTAPSTATRPARTSSRASFRLHRPVLARILSSLSMAFPPRARPFFNSLA